LSPVGIHQAESLRDHIAGEQINFAYSSDLRRALLTAKTIASGRGLKVTACPELREIDFGKIEGLTFTQVIRLYPEVIRLWAKRSSKIRYPGGESLEELDNRVSRFGRQLEKHTESETILIVAHSGALRTLVCQLMGMEPSQRWQMHLDLASLTIVETHPHQGAILNRLNDICHLVNR
jgi:alpha-ribazole phosphatase